MRVLKSSLVFGGVSSLDFGLTIEEPHITRKPEPIVTRIAVPGRGRDFLYSEGTFSNAEVSYQTWCGDSRDRDLVLSRLGEIARWLSGSEYRILSDTYDPEHFRLAWCSEPIDPEITARTYARQELVFSCDPYRYSWSGNELQSFGTGARLINEGWPSLPYIKVKGSGSVRLTVEGKASAWSTDLALDEYLELDSFEKDATKDGTSQNDKKTGDGYPVFETGEITVTVTETGGHCSGLEIRPRWRTL